MGDSQLTHSEEWYRNWRPPVIVHGELTKWGWMCLYPENLKMGHGVDVGAFTLLHAGNGLSIGDKVEIGSHCAIYSVSTISDEKGMVVLGEGCLIGSHCLIMPGVTVGSNSVVGAGTYVHRDVPAGVVIHPEQRLVMRTRKRF